MKRTLSTVIMICVLATTYTQSSSLIMESNSERFNVITSLYNETNEQRVAEYLTCLENNLAHPSIQHVHVIYDRSKDNGTNTLLATLRQKKIRISYIDRRPTFDDFFTVVNTLYHNNSKIIICNADVYFNETLTLLEPYNLKNKWIALTRWNIPTENTMKIDLERRSNGANNENSQDAWFFSAPIKKINGKDIVLGTYQCDGRIAHEARKAKFQLYNPCLTIQCLHLHLSSLRNYEQKSPKGERASMPWITLDEVPKN